MPDQRLKLELVDLDVADANKKAIALQETLKRTAISMGTQIESEITKTRSEAQDFGATLIVLLGTPAALALAKGVHDFIAKFGDKVVITTENGTVVATGAGAKNIDVAATVAALRT